VKPAVGFTLPSAGVTPAPGTKRIGTAAGCGTSSLLELLRAGLRLLLMIRFPFPRGKGLGVRFFARSARYSRGSLLADAEVAEDCVEDVFVGYLAGDRAERGGGGHDVDGDDLRWH
jgi:hypothetical protein